MIKILIGIPCMEYLPVDFVKSIDHIKAPPDVHVDKLYISMSLVYIAREKIIEAALDGGYDYVFFIDSDMAFNGDILRKLYAAQKDIVSGLAFMRSPPYSPCVYKTLKIGDGRNTVERLTEFNGVEQIAACGLACCLIKTEVFKKIRERSLCFLPLPTLGEDLAFCIRARNCGYEIWLDPDVAPLHKGTLMVNEDIWRGYNS